MKFLLDTHVFLWMAAEPEKLSVMAEECIMNAENTLYLSIVSLWEMQIKTQLGKLILDVALNELWQKQQILSDILLLLPKEGHVWELGNLPQLHRDPFDRLLIAQARYESDEDVLGRRVNGGFYTLNERLDRWKTPDHR